MDAVAPPYALRTTHDCRTTAGHDATRPNEDARIAGRREMGIEAVRIGCARQAAASADAQVKGPG
jgi:hypothetical protein